MTTSTPSITHVAETLRELGIQTLAVLREHLDGSRPQSWLTDLVIDYPTRGGKAVRPALCLATCRAFGGRVEEALPSAAAIELLHNAFLVHDDIEDESLVRRGKPTLHELAGLPLALNAGDAMLIEAMAILRGNRALLGSRMADRVLREFEQMLRHTVQGQAIELGWRRDRVVDLEADDYVDLIMRKTCWYTTIHPLRIGALIGGWNRIPLEPLVRFGTYLGAAFQIQDDLLNLLGDEETYGKEILGDLYEGKYTLMLAHLLKELDRPERSELLDGFLGMPREQRTETDARHVLDLMHRHGSIAFAQNFAEGIKAAAIHAFEPAFAAAPPSPDRVFLRDMVDFMLERQL